MSFRLSSFAVLLLLGTSSLLNAQIFHVQGGVSTLMSAEGGSVDVKTPGYDAQIGAGFLDGHFQYGILARTQLLGSTLSVGDDTMKIELPTDLFDASHYFLVRGVGLQHTLANKNGSWTAFAGTTSLGYSTPFFLAARSSEGLGAFYFEHKLGSQFRFISRNLVSARQTSIQAIEWSATRGIKLSAAGGVGSNQPYMATGLQIDWENLAVRAGYIVQGEKFERVQVRSPISTEPEKANISAMYRATHSITIRGSHQNVLQPAIDNQPILHATVNEVYSDFNLGKLNLGTGVIASHTSSRGNLGFNTYAMRSITKAISVNVNFYQSRPTIGTVSNAFTSTVREQLNQKLSLTQTLIRSNGQTTSGFGGEYIGNWFNASVGYQTVYVPFRPDNAFQQALSFNARINLPRNMQLTAGSFVDPQGTLRYTIGLGTYVYRVAGMSGPAASAQSFRFQKYVVEGIVVDTSGSPLEGAAIYINKTVAYTDSDGRFMVRVDKAGQYALSVATEEFMTAGNWEVVNAPQLVLSQTEDEAVPVRVVLRRVTVTKP